MTRGSTTSIKDKVLPFFVSCLLWLCWHTLFRHREGTSACCSWFSLCDRARSPGLTLHESFLLPQQNVHKVRNSLTPQPCGAFPSMLLFPPRSTSSYILLSRLEPSFTDVLPYRLLLLHLNSRLHARRQYHTSVTLMMALHDVARHSVPSSIKIGTRAYKNPLCRNPSGFATEVF